MLSLNNLAVRLARSGDRESALKAIANCVRVLRRQLAARYPDVHLPGLALSLNNQAAYIGSADPGRALGLVREAAEIRERLAYVAPARYERSFAVSLNNLSARLSDVGQREAALDAVDRAITLKRTTATTTPREVDSLATSLMRRSKCLTAIVARESLPDNPRNRDGLQRARARRAEVVEAMAHSSSSSSRAEHAQLRVVLTGSVRVSHSALGRHPDALRTALRTTLPLSCSTACRCAASASRTSDSVSVFASCASCLAFAASCRAVSAADRCTSPKSQPTAVKTIASSALNRKMRRCQRFAATGIGEHHGDQHCEGDHQPNRGPELPGPLPVCCAVVLVIWWFSMVGFRSS